MKPTPHQLTVLRKLENAGAVGVFAWHIRETTLEVLLRRRWASYEDRHIGSSAVRCYVLITDAGRRTLAATLPEETTR